MVAPTDDSAAGIDTAQIKAELVARLFGVEHEPVRIGRYAVLRRIGSGGMGVVYAAYDDDLDRRVAIKLVHAAVRSDDPAASERLRREAQALARVAHPNVIAVHEVGAHTMPASAGGEASSAVFIAMEFVRGTTLRSWLAASERSTSAILDVLVQAGRGLAAVHDAELVHRDVKPENVMVGDDARVRVMDFGLARVGTLLAGTTIDDGPVRDHEVTPALTRSGALVGTPAYMAPEQFGGAEVGPRADQFAFCVMAWEALFGERPFAGKTIEELSAAVVTGRRREPRTTRRVPIALRRALERGLSVEPDARWPDVPALLAALGRRPRRWRAFAALGGLAAIPIAVALSRDSDAERAQRRCADEAVQLAGVWDDERRAAVGAALLATDVAYAQDTWSRVEAGLDAYAQRWMSIQAPACSGTDASLPADVNREQLLCLDDRKRSIAALVNVLAEADADVLERAVPAVAELPSIDRCADVDYLAARVKPPDDPEVAARVEELREKNGQARALGIASKYTDGLAIVDDVLAQAQELGYGPLVADTLRLRGELEVDLGRYDAAEVTMRDAFSEALAHGDDETAVQAVTMLVYDVGYRLARFDDGLQWGVVAYAVVRRVGAGDEHEAELLQYLGDLEHARGEYQRAIDNHRKSLEIREATLGSEHLFVAVTLNNLGGDHFALAQYDQAIACHERSIAIRERVLGPEHPEVAMALNNLGNAHHMLGKYEEALAEHQRSLAIRESALGIDHPDVANSINGVGNDYYALGRIDDATAQFARALAIRERTLGSDHPELAGALNNLGAMHLLQGRYDEALPYMERALAIVERALGEKHADVARPLTNIGMIRAARGEYEAALADYGRALGILESALGTAHPDIANVHKVIADIHVELREWPAALEHYERAQAIWEKAVGAGHPDVALAVEGIGVVHEGQGRYDRAIAEYERALATIEAQPQPDSSRRGDLLHRLGSARLRTGDVDAAIELLERALPLRESEPKTADTSFAMARALTAKGTDRARSSDLVRQARTSYRAAGSDRERELGELEAWLRTTGRALAD